MIFCRSRNIAQGEFLPLYGTIRTTWFPSTFQSGKSSEQFPSGMLHLGYFTMPEPSVKYRLVYEQQCLSANQERLLSLCSVLEKWGKSAGFRD